MTPIPRLTLLAALVAAPLAAQEAAAPTCAVEFNQPKELVTLYNITRMRALQLAPGDERAKVIRDIMKTVGNPKVASANPLGTNAIAGQMMILWMMQPNSPATATRGELNWGAPKEQVIDLAKTADSLFTTVEAQGPGCHSETRPFRQAKPWQDRINAAFKFMAANEADSAEVYAKASQVLDRWSPYAPRVFAAIAQVRGSQADMMKYLEEALKLTANDTTYAEDRKAVLFQIGQVGLEYAEIQPEPQRTNTLRRAAEVLLQLATESPDAESTPYALSGLGMAATSLKDTSLFETCYSLVDKATDKYSDMSALQAAICANRMGKTAEAIRLFEATLAKNPNSRDALYNAAALMYELRKGKEMIPVVDKLVSIDPSNPDNVALYAYAYNVLNEDAKPKDPPPAAAAPAKPGAAKPVAPPPAPPSPFADSVAKYMKLNDDMPQRVVVVEFVRYADRAVVKGEIENRTKAARSYEISFELLDLAGNVVDTQVAKVENVAPSATSAFEVKTDKPKVAAWRYAPIK
ncbi:MAG: FxLYD domain-containing protein [Gemmatimonadaceae bacterium]